MVLVGCGGEKAPQSPGHAGTVPGEEATPAKEASQKGSILMVIAPRNFRDEELFKPRERFNRAGYQVVVASTLKRPAVGMLGGEVTPELTLKEALERLDSYHAVVFVGGTGVRLSLFAHPLAIKIAQEAVKKKKVLAAICLAPGILARAGVLKGVKATVYESERDTLRQHGAEVGSEAVLRDGLIITANGPAVAEDFADEILQALER
jgi:protease I